MLFYRPPVLQELDEDLVEPWQELMRFLAAEFNRVNDDILPEIDRGDCEVYEERICIWIELVCAAARIKPSSVTGISNKEWYKLRWLNLRRLLGSRFLQRTTAATARLDLYLLVLRLEGRSFALNQQKRCNNNNDSSSKNSASASHAGEDEGWKKRTIRRVCSLSGQNRVGQAFDALIQDGPAPPLISDGLQQLKHLHPPEAECDANVTVTSFPRLPFERTRTISVEDLQDRSFSFFQDRRSPGPTCLNGGLIAPVVQMRSTATLLSLLLTYISSGRVRDNGALVCLLRCSKLVGLPKPGTTVLRPVGLGDYLVKLAQKILLGLLVESGEIADLFPSIQYGISTRSGVERVIHEMQAVLSEEVPQEGMFGQDLGGSYALMQLDATNAFGSLSRRWMAQVLLQHPTLSWLYPSFRSMVWSGASDSAKPMLCYNNNSLCARVDSKTGVVQGGVLSSLIFSLGLQPWYERVLSLCSKASVEAALGDERHELWRYTKRGNISNDDLQAWTLVGRAVIDDFNCSGTLNALALVLEVAGATHPPGYVLARRKCSVLVKDISKVSPALAERFERMEVPILQHAVKLLGGVVGFDDLAIQQEVVKMYEAKKERVLRRFWERMDWNIPLQIKLILLRFCTSPALSYTLRTVRPRLAQPVLVDFDKQFLETCCMVLNLNQEERDDKKVLKAIERPTNLGGLGLPRCMTISNCAFLASCMTAGHMSPPSLTGLFFGKRSKLLMAMEEAWRSVDGVLLCSPDTRRAFLTAIGVNQTANGPLPIDRLCDSLAPCVLGRQYFQREREWFDKELLPRLEEKLRWRARDGTATHLLLQQQLTPAQIDSRAAEEMRYHRLLQAATHRMFRLQRTLTRAMWDAVAAAESSRLRTQTREAVQHRQNEHEFLNKSVDLSERDRHRVKLNSERVVLQAAAEEARWHAKCLPSTNLVWSTIPTRPELRLRDEHVRMHARAVLDLPPRADVRNCGWDRHGHAAFEGLAENNNRCFECDPWHHTWCSACTRKQHRSTVRHDEVGITLKQICQLSHCQISWEPQLRDCIARAPLERQQQQGIVISGGAEEGTGARARAEAGGGVRERRLDEMFPRAAASVVETAIVNSAGASGGGAGAASGGGTGPASGLSSARGGNERRVEREEERRASSPVIFGPPRLDPRVIMDMNKDREQVPRRAADKEKGASGGISKRVTQPSVLRSVQKRKPNPQAGSLLSLSAAQQQAILNSLPFSLQKRPQLPPSSATAASSRPPSPLSRLSPIPSAQQQQVVEEDELLVPIREREENESGDVEGWWQGELTQEDIDSGKKQKQTRRGGASGERTKASRQRETQGDLAVSGPLLPCLHLVDVHIISLSAPSRCKEWEEKPPTSKRDLTRWHVQEAVGFKNSHYAHLAKQIAPSGGHEQKDPLGYFGIKLVPAVATTNGAISEPLQNLLKVLARHKVDVELEQSPIPDMNRSTRERDRRYAECLGLFRRMLSTTLVRASSRTFTTNPGRPDGSRSARVAIPQPQRLHHHHHEYADTTTRPRREEDMDCDF